MFFKLLKLAGIDVNATIAELKADLEFKAQQVSSMHHLRLAIWLWLRACFSLQVFSCYLP
jgi:hypothetical protein